MTTAEKTIPVSVVAPGGFPTWLPSMFVKELRQGMRTRGFVGAFIVFQVLMALLMLAAVVLVPLEDNPRIRTEMLTAVDSAFWAIISVMLLLVTPGRGMAGLRTEIDNRSVDLLVLSHLTAWRIVFGKWASLMAQGLLLLVAMVPFGIMRYFTGAVDLSSDALRCGMLIMGSGMLTAAGLWASGLPRILGMLLVIVVVILQGAGGVAVVQVVMRGVSRSAISFASLALPTIFCSVLVLVFCLLNAVRRIAPPAENYALYVRILGLSALLPVMIAAPIGANRDVQGFLLVFGLIFAGVTCLIEMAGNQLPMAVHCRRLIRAGIRVPRIHAVFGLPGWPAAMWHLALTSGLGILVVSTTPVLSSREKEEVIWFIVLVFGALLFPAVAVSVFRRGKTPPSGYFIALASMGLLTALAAILDETLRSRDTFSQIVAILPVCGVFFAFERFTEDIAFVQGVAIAVTFIAGVAKSRTYWERVNELGHRRSGRIPGKSKSTDLPPSD